MGVPVVTCPGETFASRHPLSHLSNVGLTERSPATWTNTWNWRSPWPADLPRLAACGPACGRGWPPRRCATGSVLPPTWRPCCTMCGSSGATRRPIRNSPAAGTGRGAEPPSEKTVPEHPATLPGAARTVLHVGCGPFDPQAPPAQFRTADWKEVRLDIDPSVSPDVVASITDMSAVPSNSVDAVWSSHNLEHLYAHEVPLALREFWRVLKPGGVAVLALPDIQEVAQRRCRGESRADALRLSGRPDLRHRHHVRTSRLDRPRQPLHGAQDRFYRREPRPEVNGGRLRHGRCPSGSASLCTCGPRRRSSAVPSPDYLETISKGQIPSSPLPPGEG